MKLLSFKLLLGSLFFLLFVCPVFGQSFTNPEIYEITPGIPLTPITTQGVTFFTKEFDLNYKDGPVIISGGLNGTDNFLSDDGSTIEVTKPDGSTNSWDHPYHSFCIIQQYSPPVNLSYLFSKGINHVKVRLYDICGGWISSSPMYLLTEKADPISSNPQPFLDLPWDYSATGMTFNDSATAINSYFDHQYPFLSTNLTEPPLIVRYFSGTPVDDDYSSHDGYDYGNKAKTKLNTPVLAAADGEATYMSSCLPCGNAILIDHKNGYQTRYYHMQPEGLITNVPGQKVNVTKGQQIGKVGFSGNVKPPKEPGSHLHFMVVQDKNNDGNFEDNIPDGLTDPFGWQSTEPDPWENYSFNYTGKARTGNKSYYLFTKPLDNLNSTLTSNEAIFEIGKAKLEFPQGSTNENINIKADSVPNFVNDLLNSLGSVLKVKATDNTGQAITTFLKNFSLTLSFSQFDLSRYNLNTLSIYSSPDGQNWTKENTQVDLNGKTATTSINHLTQFALMAERKDTIAPTTIAILEGQKGNGNNFRADVKVNLSAADNPGGLGVEFTAYAIGDGDLQTYTTPLTFSNEGNYKIQFYSQDKDENIEGVKTVEFSIDKTTPEAKVFIDLDKLDLVLEGIDSNPTSVNKTDNLETKKKDDGFYTISDLAGNSLRIDVRDRDKNKQDLFRIHSLQYNNNPPTLPALNYFNVTYQGKKEKLNIAEENFKINNEVKIRIQYNAKKNQSTIITKDSGSEKVKEIVPGLSTLKLQTNKGKLEYSY